MVVFFCSSTRQMDPYRHGDKKRKGLLIVCPFTSLNVVKILRRRVNESPILPWFISGDVGLTLLLSRSYDSVKFKSRK